MQTMSAKVDRQATSLLDISFWSDIAIIVLLAVANYVNFIQAASDKGPLFTFSSPEVVLIASAALALWLGYSCIGLLATKSRLGKVQVSLDGEGVSGFALTNPTARENAESFSLPYASIKFVGIVDVAITKKHTVPSLKIATDERGYIIPAPEHLQELLHWIVERMTAES